MAGDLLNWEEMEKLIKMKKDNPSEYNQKMNDIEGVLFDFGIATMSAMEKLRRLQMEMAKKEQDVAKKS